VQSTVFHILSIAAFLALPYLFTPPHPPDAGNRIQDYLVLKKIATNTLLVMVFYLNYYVLLPRYFFTKKYGHFVASLAIPGLIATLLVEMLWSPRFGGGRRPDVPHDVLHDVPRDIPHDISHDAPQNILHELSHNVPHVETNFVLFALVVLVSVAIAINNRWQEAERQKRAAELSFLKAQINPHFLFNTLNSIYALAVKQSAMTAPAIVKLSGLMRYVITDAQTETVSLDKEIAYVVNYCELQRIRLGATATIILSDVATTIGANALVIAPLVLIPFVENAFKYGVNPETDSPVTITIELHGTSTLHLKTHNRKVHKMLLQDVSQDAPLSSGVGIANVRTRLAMMYADCHSLEIAETDTDYSVHLIIELTP
jgi:hypothetical protein